MRFRKAALAFGGALLICAGALAAVRAGYAAQQAPAKNEAPAAAAAPRLQANLDQVMRGILFPNANVVFYAQSEDPAAVKEATKPSSATDPLASVYGGWEAVENSALALSESASLLAIPGRFCSNGKPVPVKDVEWVKFVEELRVSGLVAYEAAQSKSNDKMLDAADKVSTACLDCHDRFRQRPGGITARCT